MKSDIRNEFEDPELEQEFAFDDHVFRLMVIAFAVCLLCAVVYEKIWPSVLSPL
jgi:hypothetical protein